MKAQNNYIEIICNNKIKNNTIENFEKSVKKLENKIKIIIKNITI